MKRRTKIIIGVSAVVVVAIGGLIVRGGGSSESVQTDTVKSQDAKQTVLATGSVTSSVDLKLGFKASGIVKKIPAIVGKTAKEGEILAQLDQRDQLATAAQARASLASAQANLTKVLAGATSEEVQVAQASVDAANVSLQNAKKVLEDTKTQQATLVKNAYTALVNNGLAARPQGGTNSGVSVTVTGSYSKTDFTSYIVKVEQSGNGWRYDVQGPDAISGYLSIGVPLQITTRGLYITFSATPSVSDSWVVEVPNTQSSGYVTYMNAYNAAVETQRTAVTAAENAVASASVGVDQAVANLNLKKAQARPADVQAAQAQVLAAQAQMASASSNLENTIIRAPADGTITKVDIKVGEQASALQSVIVLQDTGNLHVEANISEANVAHLQIGQKVTITFDALGSDREFQGSLIAIDPASTVVSGVVNYKITVSIDNTPEIKPGMTANLTVIVAEKSNILTVPQRAITMNGQGKGTIRVITDPKKKTYKEIPVTVGDTYDGGVIEVISGVAKGDEIVVLVTKK